MNSWILFWIEHDPSSFLQLLIQHFEINKNWFVEQGIKCMLRIRHHYPENIIALPKKIKNNLLCVMCKDIIKKIKTY